MLCDLQHHSWKSTRLRALSALWCNYFCDWCLKSTELRPLLDQQHVLPLIFNVLQDFGRGRNSLWARTKATESQDIASGYRRQIRRGRTLRGPHYKSDQSPLNWLEILLVMLSLWDVLEEERRNGSRRMNIIQNSNLTLAWITTLSLLHQGLLQETKIRRVWMSRESHSLVILPWKFIMPVSGKSTLLYRWGRLVVYNSIVVLITSS